MLFFILLVIAFGLGIFVGILTAPYVSPRSPTTIIIVMLPFFFLYFFSQNPVINEIRYLFLALAIGIFTYWTISQVKYK